jgi:hypothetical protein
MSTQYRDIITVDEAKNLAYYILPLIVVEGGTLWEQQISRSINQHLWDFFTLFFLLRSGLIIWWDQLCKSNLKDHMRTYPHCQSSQPAALHLV